MKPYCQEFDYHLAWHTQKFAFFGEILGQKLSGSNALLSCHKLQSGTDLVGLEKIKEVISPIPPSFSS